MTVRPIVLRPAPPTALPVPEPGGPARVLAVAAERTAAGVRGAMATVLARRGSSPATPGQKIYLGSDGTCVGTIGGGAVERAVLEDLGMLARGAVPVAGGPERGTESGVLSGDGARTGTGTRTGAGGDLGSAAAGTGHAVRTFRLGPDLGMCCGGQVDVMIEPLVPATPCLVVGAGHVATALAPLLAGLGFEVAVLDSRDAWARAERLPGVRVITGEVTDPDVSGALAAGAGPRGACLVMTHDHAADQVAIEWALRQGFALVGGVGSRAKAARVRSRLEAAGFDEADRARVRMPLGAEIGARTPEEIAVSIAAHLIAWRAGR